MKATRSVVIQAQVRSCLLNRRMFFITSVCLQIECIYTAVIKMH